MTYEEEKKLIKAAEILKEYCKNSCCNSNNTNCLFEKTKGECSIRKDYPTAWVIPKVTRWSPEDIALAKALKAFDAIIIKRWATGYITWEDKDGRVGYIPPTSFKNLQKSNEIFIDTILKEAEE